MKHNKENSTCQTNVPRGKHHNKIATKTTVSLYLNRNRVEKARNHNLNLSRVTENALNNILSYIISQNRQNSIFLGEAFGKEGSLVRSPGFEPEYPAWEAGVLTRLDYDRLNCLNITATSIILALAFGDSLQGVNHIFSSHS